MKKLITLVCTLACVLSLSACGNEKQLTDYEQEKINTAKQIAVQEMLPTLIDMMDPSIENPVALYNGEELESIYSYNGKKLVDGNGFKSAVESFRSSAETVGEIISIGDPVATVDKDTIIVRIDLDCTGKDAQAEIILSNDIFFILESAALNPIESTSDKMVKATMNTIVGMGTVFLVLILIRYIIELFIYIPPFVEKMTAIMNKIFSAFKSVFDKLFKKKKVEEEVKTESLDNTIQQIVEKEENNNLASDLELVAVITAAIAAYESNVPADGFVVRSIRKVNRR